MTAAQTVVCARCEQPGAAHASDAAPSCDRFAPQLLTPAGLAQATALLHTGRGERFDDERLRTWMRRLGEFTDDDVWRAAEMLVDRPSDPRAPGGIVRVELGDVVYAARQTRNRRKIAEDARARHAAREADRAAIESGAVPWEGRPAGERAALVARARAYVGALFPGAVGHRVLIDQLARFFARGGELPRPEPPPLPAGVEGCAGCGCALLGIDPWPEREGDPRRCRWCARPADDDT